MFYEGLYKAFIKHFEASQRSVKKIYIFFFLSGIGTLSVNLFLTNPNLKKW